MPRTVLFPRCPGNQVVHKYDVASKTEVYIYGEKGNAAAPGVCTWFRLGSILGLGREKRRRLVYDWRGIEVGRFLICICGLSFVENNGVRPPMLFRKVRSLPSVEC